MNETMAEVRASTQEQQQATAAGTYTPVAPPPPPPPHRRPRVREVSSRFMSPVVSSSSSGDLHLLATKSPLPKHTISTPAEFHSRQQQQRSNSVQRPRHQELEPLCCADENRPETSRSLETPLGSQGKVVMSIQRKQRAVKLFKENGGRREEQQQQQQHPDASRSKTCDGGKLSGRSGSVAPSRPGTPTVSGMDRMTSSRLRLTTQNFQHSTNISVVPTATAAAKLLHSSGMSSSAQTPNMGTKVNGASFQEPTSIPVNSSSLGDDDDYDRGFARTLAKNPTSSELGSCITTGHGSICSSSPIPVQNCKTQSLPDLRSSMPEAGMLPTVSTRLLAERNCSRGNVISGDSSKFSASPCSRSLNLPLSSCEHSLFHSSKTSEKPTSLLSKPYTNSVRMGPLCLPPLPSCTKLGTDARKGRKVSGHQEDVHSLRLLHNRYLQWRYANAKAKASMHSQRREIERTLYSLGVKISDLCDSVKRKRIELGLLQRTKTLSTILEAQMPYLDEWSAMEGDYSTSLLGAIQALLNASLQLPISGNVRADTREVGEALNSAIKVMEIIAFRVQSFMPKAEEMENLISELAGLIGGERALIEECGELLSRTYTSQMEECSLRGQLIQLHRSSPGQPIKE